MVAPVAYVGPTTWEADMAIALSLKERPYILKADKELPEVEQTVFFLRPLTMKESTDIQDSLMETKIQRLGPKSGNENTQRLLLGQQMLKTLLGGIERIENFKDPEGQEIKYHRNMKYNDKVAVLDVLHPDWRSELLDEILGMSKLSGEEEKN